MKNVGDGDAVYVCVGAKGGYVGRDGQVGRTTEPRLRLLGLAAVGRPPRWPGPPRRGPLPGAPKCPIFPRTSHWNKRVDKLPLLPGSAAMVAAVGADRARARGLRLGPLRRRPDRHPLQGGAARASGGCR